MSKSKELWLWLVGAQSIQVLSLEVPHFHTTCFDFLSRSLKFVALILHWWPREVQSMHTGRIQISLGHKWDVILGKSILVHLFNLKSWLYFKAFVGYLLLLYWSFSFQNLKKFSLATSRRGAGDETEMTVYPSFSSGLSCSSCQLYPTCFWESAQVLSHTLH